MATAPISNDAFADALNRARQVELAAKIGTEETGTKRPLEDPEFNAAKRLNNDNGIVAMDPSNVSENWSVPDQMVGLIIGRGGEQISNIQNETGCRVQMAPETVGTGSRGCTLTGSRQAVEMAKARIQEIINKSGGRPPPAHNSPMPPMGMGGGGGSGYAIELMVPGQKVGLLIGKSGETLKGLQDKTGCRMTVIQETNAMSSEAKPLRIMGDPAKCQYAKQLVEELLASKDDHANGFRGERFGGGNRAGGGYGQKSLGEVIVPRLAVGMIIGKAGETIKRIQSESGARIQFKQQEDPNGPERTALLTGTPEQIQHATQLITELVNQAMGVPGSGGAARGGAARMGSGGGSMGMFAGGGDQQVFYMHVPSNKTGLIIGKGGEVIKQINQETGAYVELSRDPPPSDYEKIFIIKGSPAAIHAAQHAIRIKVGDVPPGTPCPPFQGAQSGGGAGAGGAYGAPSMGGPGANPYAAMAAAAAAQQQQAAMANQYGAAQAAGGGGDAANTAAWAAYYAQYYQQQQQQQAGATAAVPATNVQQPGQQQQTAGANPQASTAPTINPATGQPDYSAQWAEYYRSLGMHEQANMIEQQAKANQAQAAAGQAHTVAAQQNAYAAYGGAAQAGGHQTAVAQPAAAPAAPAAAYGFPTTAYPQQYGAQY